MKQSGLVFDCALFLLLSVPLTTNNQAAETQQGDLDQSGIIDAADQVILSNYLAGNLDSIPAQFGQFYEYNPIVKILRLVPGGTFTQGSPPDEPCRMEMEAQFTHTLTLAMSVMETEVTRQMWADLRAVQPTLPADPTDAAHGAGMTNPVQSVTWYEAVLYANLLAAQQGLTRCYYTDAGFTTPVTASNYTTGPFYCDFNANGYRLPTEGEWEYFCRAGATTPFWIPEPNYNSGNCAACTSGLLPNLESAAVFCANNPGGTAAVATKEANPWGLYDTHGNVWEWCWDWFGDYPSGSATDYRGAAAGSRRMNHGGGWNTGPNGCRSDHRGNYYPDGRLDHLGFRLVRSL